jgi:hypothetical protein
MATVIYDVFAGEPGKDAMWVQAVAGLENAQQRMRQLSTEKPGRYFLFCAAEDAVIAQIESFARPQAPQANPEVRSKVTAA